MAQQTTRFLLFIAGFTGLCAAPLLCPAIQPELQKYQWEYRLILYTLAPEDSDRFSAKINEALTQLDERKLRLIALESGADPLPRSLSLTPDSRMLLAKNLGVQLGQTELILIGLDGGIKKRLQTTNLNEIFQLTDAMPMRRRELQKKNEL